MKRISSEMTRSGMQGPWALVLAGITAMASGCGDHGVADGPLVEDDPAAAARPGPVETAATATVTGRWYTRCKQGTFWLDYLYDLRGTAIRALIPDDSPAGYRVIEGSGDASSSFSIPDVPVGVPYVLHLGQGYYVTDQHRFDVYGETTLRCFPSPSVPELETPVTVALSGLTRFDASPFRTHHTVELVSHALGTTSYALTNSNLIRPDDTSISATVDWGDWNYLPDATLGDDVHVLHRATRYPHDPLQYRTTSVTSLVDLFYARGFSLQDGVPATISGTFENLTPNRTVSLSIDRALFDANYQGRHPQAGISAQIVTERGEEVFRADMGSMVRGTSTVNTLVDGAYADPFPSTSRRSSVIRHFMSQPLHMEEGQTHLIGFNNFHRRPFPGPIEPGPILPAPSEILLDGQPFLDGGLVPLTSAAPVPISWSPVSGATSYRVEVRRARSSFELTAVFRTTGTSLAMPAVLFEDGGFYVFRLSAIRAGNRHHKGQLIPVDITSNVEILSGRFLFSSSCGDGVVQPGEACDDGGPSSRCNVDCTASSCGDGLHNSASGEACDGAMEVAGCDRDCSLPTCGDGRVNWSAHEDCDDGNTVDDGNGCGADCEYNNVCGNFVVESAVENCDQGGVNTATCTAECRTSFCGDGYVNPAAGEQCDDGFFDRRRCNSSCRWITP